MKKTVVFYIALCIMAFASCKNKGNTDNANTDTTKSTNTAVTNETNTDKTPATGTTNSNDDFTALFRTVYDALSQKRYADLQQYVNPTYGIYKIYNPGAMSVIVHSTTIDEKFMGVEGTNRFTQPCELTYGAAPKFDCETGWAADGCFVQELTSCQELASLQKALVDYGMADADATFMDKLVKHEANIKRNVVMTLINVKIYFAQIDGKWYIATLDLQHPCSA